MATLLIAIADNETTDPACKSVQTVLSHVVKSGYGYAIYIRRLLGNQTDFRDFVFHSSIIDYQKDLDDVFLFTTETFKNINDNQLEEPDNSKKMITSWEQIYDIEQLTEHAIVHILRHRRQIEKFKILLRK